MALNGYRQPTYGPTNQYDEYGNYIGNTVDVNQNLAPGMENTMQQDTMDFSGLMPDSSAGYGQNQGGNTGMSGKDMFGVGFGAMNAGLGLANYFENKKFNKSRIKGIDENIKASKEQRQQRRDFRSNTKNAFGVR